MTLQTRPPIVAVLGHVDHGKTSLLDKIRNTSIALQEAGGITQSIGAWQTETKEGKKITFIDTPGHAAFNNMRSRGAKLADIAILVVAADDGPMPQTKESLEYLREAQTPFIVAITKVDLGTAQVEVVKGKLAQEGVLLEGRGGDVVAIEVSSQTGQGIEDLVEVLGFDTLPLVGAFITSNESPLSSVSTTYNLRPSRKRREGFWIILKADTAGSLEAIKGQLGEKVGIAFAGVGDFVESDVTMSSSTNSPLVGFNTRAGKDIQKMADEEGVKIYSYKIIYELLADVEKWQKELEESQSEKVVGRAQVIAQFPHEKNTRIAGCKILEGRITKNDKLRLVREDKTLGNIRALSLKTH